MASFVKGFGSNSNFRASTPAPRSARLAPPCKTEDTGVSQERMTSPSARLHSLSCTGGDQVTVEVEVCNGDISSVALWNACCQNLVRFSWPNSVLLFCLSVILKYPPFRVYLMFSMFRFVAYSLWLKHSKLDFSFHLHREDLAIFGKSVSILLK